jgi:hypothetical protein
MVLYTHREAAIAAVALMAGFSLISLFNNDAFTSMRQRGWRLGAGRSSLAKDDAYDGDLNHIIAHHGQGFANAQTKLHNAEVLFKTIRAYEHEKEDYEHAPEYERKSRTPPDWRTALEWVGLNDVFGGGGTSGGVAPEGGSGGLEGHPSARQVSSGSTSTKCVPPDVHGCKCDVSLPRMYALLVFSCAYSSSLALIHGQRLAFEIWAGRSVHGSETGCAHAVALVLIKQ